jgi:hypothetical protein
MTTEYSHLVVNCIVSRLMSMSIKEIEFKNGI